jgi:cell division protein FtsZ
MDTDRRDTLRLLSAAVLGISLHAVASSRPAIRVIGVGDAGVHIVLSARSSGLLQANEYRPEFACVTMGQQSSQAISVAQRLHTDSAPIRTVQLGPLGSGGDVGIARDAALKHRSELRSLMDSAEVVILVAGLGGGVGSIGSPLLATMAKEAGAQTLAVLVTPFTWELGRFPNAFDAIKNMRRNCDFMVALSNQATGNAMGDEATLEDVIKQQEQDGTDSIRMLMRLGTRFSKNNQNRLT